MRFFTFLFCLFFTLNTFAQTSISEYLYLTRDYPEAVAKGHTPDLAGYYLEDLLELRDGTGIVKLLYKNNQQSIIPVATQLTIFSDESTFYICVPNERSGKEIFNRYSDDIQSIFAKSSKAQSIFSVLMVQYPIELQKFYDEIKALEEVYTIENTSDNTKSDETLSVKDNNSKRKSKGSRLSGESRTKGLDESKSKVTARNIDKKEEKTKPKQKARNSGADKPKVTARNIDKKEEKSTTPEAKEEVKVVSVTEGNSVGITDYTKVKKDRLATGRTTSELGHSLRRRKLLARPEFDNPTGKAGHVRIDICIDSKGKIISAKPNKASNSKDPDLIDWSIKLTRQYKFARSSSSRQCGYILFKYN